VKSNGLGGVVLTDVEYPSRVAFSLLSTALDEFDRESYGWQKAVTDNMYPPTRLEVYLKEYQDPANADKILAIHRDLDETKVIMHEAIESVLVRGEKLDVLVDRSRDLSRQSKVFYKTAKKHNSCCSIQ
jgi:synaptobrevin homolog YKT6